MVEVGIFCILPPFSGLPDQLIVAPKVGITIDYRHKLLLMKEGKFRHRIGKLIEKNRVFLTKRALWENFSRDGYGFWRCHNSKDLNYFRLKFCNQAAAFWYKNYL